LLKLSFGVNIKATRRKKRGREGVAMQTNVFDLALSYSAAIECHSMLII